MSLQELQKLRNLNVELLQTNISVWDRISRFCAMHHIEIPYDPQLQYNLRRAVDIIADINDSVGESPMRNIVQNHPDTEQHPNRRILTQ